MVNVEGLGQRQRVDQTWVWYMRKNRSRQELFGLIEDPKTKPEFWKKAIDTLLGHGESTIEVKVDVDPDTTPLHILLRGNTKEVPWTQ